MKQATDGESCSNPGVARKRLHHDQDHRFVSGESLTARALFERGFDSEVTRPNRSSPRQLCVARRAVELTGLHPSGHLHFRCCPRRQ